MSESLTAEPQGLPPGMVAVPLGKYLRRQEALARRTQNQQGPGHPAGV